MESMDQSNGAEQLSTIDRLTSRMAKELDKTLPPRQRDEMMAQAKEFVSANPKLSAFLAINIALTGVPLVSFMLFSSTVATFSILTGVTVGLLAAFFFFIFWVGIALSMLIPTIFITTTAACFLFVSGLFCYSILNWASGGQLFRAGGKADPLGSESSRRDSLNPVGSHTIVGKPHNKLGGLESDSSDDMEMHYSVDPPT